MRLVGKVSGEFFYEQGFFSGGGTGSAFLVQTKDLGDGGRSEEKRCYAVNPKQKSTKNLFLVGSFLTCCLAGPFCQNLPLSTNDLESVACRKGR